MQRFADTGVRWISRVPAPSREASTLHSEEPASWERRAEGQTQWCSRQVELAHGRERWVVVETTAGVARTRATLAKRAQRDQEQWERQLGHLANQACANQACACHACACHADAQAAVQRHLKTLPVWLRVTHRVSSRPHYAGKGRPSKGHLPARQTWHVHAQLTLDDEQLAREAPRQARVVVAPKVLDPTELPDEDVIGRYKAQAGVQRGFAFLKDPLFLASSVFLKRPERIMALACIMVLCLLVYRRAEWRLPQQLAIPHQPVPNQLKQPTNRPTMRWMFACFEGSSLLTLPSPGGSQALIHGLAPLHQLVLSLLGPTVSKLYESSN
jgi:transposase